MGLRRAVWRFDSPDAGPKSTRRANKRGGEPDQDLSPTFAQEKPVVSCR